MVKREGGKKEIAIIIFRCDKCGHEEKYKQVRGGFVKLNEAIHNDDFKEQKAEITEKKETEKKSILWFNV